MSTRAEQIAAAMAGYTDETPTTRERLEAAGKLSVERDAEIGRLKVIEAAARQLHASAIQVVSDGGIYYRVRPYLLINLNKAIWPPQPAALTPQERGANI